MGERKRERERGREEERERYEVGRRPITAQTGGVGTRQG